MSKTENSFYSIIIIQLIMSECFVFVTDTNITRGGNFNEKSYTYRLSINICKQTNDGV